MANVILRPDWALPESACTTKVTYTNRRKFIQALGLGSLGFAAMGGCSAESRGMVDGPLDKIPKKRTT